MYSKNKCILADNLTNQLLCSSMFREVRYDGNDVASVEESNGIFASVWCILVNRDTYATICVSEKYLKAHDSTPVSKIKLISYCSEVQWQWSFVFEEMNSRSISKSGKEFINEVLCKILSCTNSFHFCQE